MTSAAMINTSFFIDPPHVLFIQLSTYALVHLRRNIFDTKGFSSRPHLRIKTAVCHKQGRMPRGRVSYFIQLSRCDYAKMRARLERR